MSSQEHVSSIVQQVFDVIESRKENAPEGSYTAKLYAAGETEILKKIGEEAVEVVVAASKESNERVIYELTDLLYHSMVLLAARGLSWSDIERELARRVR